MSSAVQESGHVLANADSHADDSKLKIGLDVSDEHPTVTGPDHDVQSLGKHLLLPF